MDTDIGAACMIMICNCPVMTGPSAEHTLDGPPSTSDVLQVENTEHRVTGDHRHAMHWQSMTSRQRPPPPALPYPPVIAIIRNAPVDVGTIDASCAPNASVRDLHHLHLHGATMQ